MSVDGAVRSSLVAGVLLAILTAACGKPIVFRPIAELPLDPNSVRRTENKVQIEHGHPVEPSLFPASFWMYTSGTYCSATLIGPNTLLLAGHCIKVEEPMELDAFGGIIPGTCYRHPSYSADGYLRDLALCVLERDVQGVLYERVVTDSPPSNESVLLAVGFGCDGQDTTKTLRVGVMAVEGQPTEADDHLVLRGLTSVGVDENGLPTAPTNGKPAQLCPGDSGGASYSFAFPLGPGPRSVVAVNSSTREDHRSIVTSLGTEHARTFLQEWVAKGAKICGLTAGLSGCRS